MNKTETSAARSFDFSYLDSDLLRKKYASGVDQNKVSFYVSGISCGTCVRKLEGLTAHVPGLLDLRVELQKKIAHVEVDLKQTSFSDIAGAIRSAGFEPIPLNAESEADQLQRKEDRLELVRLAVASACAGNIMSFAFATYFGASEEWATLFQWLSFALYIPVLTFVAWPFYRGAYFALRNRRISIDLPMTVASVSGFIFSTAELVQGRSDIYYDSLSSFLFLILLSRFGQRRLQRKLLSPAEILESLQLQRVRQSYRGAWRWIATEQVKVGDEIQLRSDETVPADCDLVSRVAHFSLAFLSGESRAKTCQQGSPVPAGARLIDPEARLLVRRTLDNTSFGKLLQQTREYSLSHNKSVQIADRWAQWLLGIVMTIALGFLIWYWPQSHLDAVRRTLALIVLACPCAMAFGTPLAIAAAIKKCQRLGILVRDGGVFERAKNIKTIFFDKTGTLTSTDLQLETETDKVSKDTQNIILALEQKSFHPIAFAFRKAFHAVGQPLQVHNYKEVPGQGVEGIISGQLYQLVRAPQSEAQTSCVLKCNHQDIQRFYFGIECKPDAFSVLQSLRKQGFNLQLLSGDQQESTESFGLKLGFRLNEIFSGLTPEQKGRIVAKTPNSMMVGDGVNDSLALMQASVGVAVSGGVEAALKSSQILLTQPSLNAVHDLIASSRSAFTLIRRNLIVSVVYNVVAGSLALAGLINPFVAALLMPVSSGFVLLTTWIGSRT